MTAINPVVHSQHLQIQHLQGSAVVIACKLPDGKGDVATGYDSYKLTQKIFPQLQIVFSYVNPEPSDMDKEFRSMPRVDLTKEDEKNWEVVEISKIYARIKKKEFKFILLTSAMYDKFFSPIILNSNIPIIKLQEYGLSHYDDDGYGFVKPPVYCLGLGPQEKGVIFPHHLYQTYLNPTKYKSVRERIHLDKFYAKEILDYVGIVEDSAIARLQYLRSVPLRLRELILGNRLDIPNQAEKTIKAFSEGSQLYCGYSHSYTICAFINVICCKKGNKDITICLLMNYPKGVLGGKTGKTFNQFLLDDAKYLMQAGFNRIEVYAPNNPFEERVIPLDCFSSRVLRIIIQPLPAKEADALAQASERETLTTGDSSFLKALALNKITAYEVRPHKVGYIKSFIDIARKESPQLADLLSMSFFGNRKSQLATYSYDDIMVNMMNLFEYIKDNDALNLALNQTIKKIASDHDLESTLPQIILENIEADEKVRG